MLYINPPTAALLLSEFVTLSPGDWVIQDAGNSGVGRWVIAFARERGLKTVSLVRRVEFIDELTAAGGDVVLVDGAGVANQVAEATGHAQILLALDGIAGEAMTTLSSCLAAGGTLGGICVHERTIRSGNRQRRHLSRDDDSRLLARIPLRFAHPRNLARPSRQVRRWLPRVNCACLSPPSIRS